MATARTKKSPPIPKRTHKLPCACDTCEQARYDARVDALKEAKNRMKVIRKETKKDGFGGAVRLGLKFAIDAVDRLIVNTDKPLLIQSYLKAR
jgi:hypothetical protein